MNFQNTGYVDLRLTSRPVSGKAESGSRSSLQSVLGDTVESRVQDHILDISRRFRCQTGNFLYMSAKSTPTGARTHLGGRREKVSVPLVFAARSSESLEMGFEVLSDGIHLVLGQESLDDNGAGLTQKGIDLLLGRRCIDTQILELVVVCKRSHNGCSRNFG